MKENIICRVVKVDCVRNDPNDIRFGGPKFLGFDFYIKKDEVESMMDYIRCMLYEYNIPFINIRNAHAKIVNEDDLYDREKLIEFFNTKAPKLLEEFNNIEQNKKLSIK